MNNQTQKLFKIIINQHFIS